MLLTSRDRRLLQWINGHGFVTADQGGGMDGGLQPDRPAAS